MNRRQFITKSSGLLLSLPMLTHAQNQKRGKRLGLSIASYRRGSRFYNEEFPAWKNALDVLDHCKSLKAGCLQIGVRGWTRDFAGKVRERRENLDIRLEGQISLPRKESDIDRFDETVRMAKEAGATVLRTVCLGGRRYETFRKLEDWQYFKTRSWESLVRAEKIVRQHGVKLAFENHKDWRSHEQLDLLHRLSSESVGVCFDFGNNVSLLEDPHVQVEALAPFIMTTHLKDMGAQACEDGFLLSEVPLGEGMLDLNQLCDVCERANPDIQFNLEMITRDPLIVPVFKDEYWLTMKGLPAHELATILKWIKQHPPRKPLPSISDKSDAQRLAFEEANVRECFQYARKQLGLS